MVGAGECSAEIQQRLLRERGTAVDRDLGVGATRVRIRDQAMGIDGEVTVAGGRVEARAH